jgi:hypothetical protein
MKGESRCPYNYGEVSRKLRNISEANATRQNPDPSQRNGCGVMGPGSGCVIMARRTRAPHPATQKQI